MGQTKPPSIIEPPPADKPSISKVFVLPELVRTFLPDAEEIEKTPISPAAGWVLYTLTILIVTALLWACFSQVDRIVVARGKLVTTTGSVVLQPLETAVIRSINVREGHIVKRGDVLGTFDPTFTKADVSQYEGRAISMNAQIARLEAELQQKSPPPTTNAEEVLQEQLYHSRQKFYAARLSQFAETANRFKVQLRSAEEDVDSLLVRIENLKKINKIYEEAFKQTFGARVKVLESSESLMNMQQQLQQSRNRMQEVSRSVAETEAERTAFTNEWMQKATDELIIARRERDLAVDQLGKAQRKEELVSLTAPTDAVVLEVAKRSVGSVVREAEPLFTLVPLGTPLEAEVEVETADIGLVRVGDHGRIKLDAFPFQKYGTLEGTLRTFSQDAFSRTQQQQASLKGEFYYIARLELGPISAMQVPENTLILPGMAVTAEITVGQRTVISYFLYPLIRMMDESIREP